MDPEGWGAGIVGACWYDPSAANEVMFQLGEDKFTNTLDTRLIH